MSQKTLSGSIALSKLKHVKMTCKGKNGPVDGIFIPFEANKLVIIEKTLEDGKKETQVFMPCRVIYKEEQDSKGQNGFIAKSLSTEDYKALKTDEEKEAAREIQPILGSIKDFTSGGGDNASGAESNESFDPADDLPF